MKRLLIGLVIVVASVLVLGGGIWFYLKSTYATDRVVTMLQKKFGPSVQVDKVEIGVGGQSSIRGLVFLEEGQETSPTPWLTVDNLQADVGLLSYLGGTSVPGQVSADGAKMILRWDRDGNFITQLPSNMQTYPETSPGEAIAQEEDIPNVTLKNAQVTLHREGQEPMVLQNIQGQLVKQEGKMVLTGEAADATWGTWKIHGTFNQKDRTVALALKQEGYLNFTPALLSKIPIIPPTTWEEVQVKGEATGSATATFHLDTEKLAYRIDLQPRKTQVQFPSVDLPASDVKGTLVIQDDQITFQDVQGAAFAGTFQGHVRLDFGNTPLRLIISEIHVHKADVSQLPKSWNFPSQIKGLLTGQAKLGVDFIQDGPQFWGKGQATINEAKLAGLPAEPILLELHASKEGIFWLPSSKKTSLAPRPSTLPLILWGLTTSALVQPEQPKPFDLPKYLAQGASVVTRQLEYGTEWFLQTGAAVVDQFGLAPSQPEAKPQTAKAAPRTLDIKLKMKKIELAEFIQKMNLKLPFTVAGKLSFDVQASIPIDNVKDPKHYRAKGNAQIEQFRLAEVRLDEIHANVTYDNGVLSLDQLQGNLAGTKDAKGGTFQGTARLPVIPLGDLSAQLSLHRISLDTLAPMVPGGETIQGEVSGNVTLRAPGSTLGNMETWHARGQITSTKIQALGLTLQNATADFQMEKGQFTLTSLKTSLEGAPITATAKLALAAPHSFEAQADLNNWNLAAFQRLAPQFRLPVPMEGNLTTHAAVQGTLNPMRLDTKGTLDAANLKVYGLSFTKAHAAWSGDTQQLTLKDLSLHIDKSGEISGQVVMPLDPKLPGSLDLRFKEVEVGQLTKDVPELPVKIQGTVNGSLQGKIASPGPDQNRQISMNLDLKAPTLQVQGIPTEQLQGKLNYQNGLLDYNLEGKTLGGSFELQGKVPATNLPAEKLPQGRLSIQNIQLARLWRATISKTDLPPLSGTLNLNLNFTHPSLEAPPNGSGVLRLENLRWQGTPLANRFQGDIHLNAGEIRLGRLEGNLGDGQVSAQVVYNLLRPGRRYFTLNLENVDVGQFLVPLGIPLEGHVVARVRGNMGRGEWFGSADVTLPRGSLAGVPVSDWRLPITWGYSPRQAAGHLNLPETAGQVAQGRFHGNASLSWNTSWNVEGKLQFYEVELPALQRQSSDSSMFGSGRASGRVNFSGRDVGSINDLTGTVDATFGRNQAMSFPVFRQITPFLGASPSTSFQKGELRGRFNDGIVRVQRLTLEGETMTLFGDGRVTFQGRLDLNVTVANGNIGPNLNALRWVGMKIPLASATPLGLALHASDLLSNHVVHMHITGTIRTPVVQVQPLRLLADEGLRFFLQKAGVPLAGATPLP